MSWHSGLLIPLIVANALAAAASLALLVRDRRARRRQRAAADPLSRARVVEALANPVLVVDEEWRVADLNPAARRVLGRPARHVLGQPLANLGPAWAALATPDEGGVCTQTVPAATGEGEQAFDVFRTALARPDGTLAGWALLLCDRGAQRQEQQRLEAILQQRELLVREVHHRVKNDLQVVSSLLSLAGSALPEGDSAAITVLRESRDRIRSMALVHEQLYRAPNVSKLSFAAYADELLRHLQQTYNAEARAIRVHTEIEDADLGLDATMTCGLIINELVSNAFRHAFPEGRSGEVRVSLRSADGRHTLEVANDGVALPPDDELAQADTLGLQLVASLVHQLGGRLEVLREGGTLFRIAFGAPAPR